MFRAWLRERHSPTPAQTAALSAAHLPKGYGRFGLEAIPRLIAVLEQGGLDDRVIVYSEAVHLAGLGHHSDLSTGKGLRSLPYYGTALERQFLPGTGDASDPDDLRIGRLTNPTVHIGLNQLRRVANPLIARYGPPAGIAIELARELKLTDDEKKARNRENNDNRLTAERRARSWRN